MIDTWEAEANGCQELGLVYICAGFTNVKATTDKHGTVNTSSKFLCHHTGIQAGSQE